LADFPRHIEWNHPPQQMTALTGGPVQVDSRYKTMEAMPSNTPMKRWKSLWEYGQK
jgi:hypothetical protein